MQQTGPWARARRIIGIVADAVGLGHPARWLWSRNNHFARKNWAYDRATIRIIRSLPATASCIDVGAHKGSILREIVKACPDGNHHAFEPLPDLAANLAHDFPRVQVHRAALDNGSGEAAFTVSADRAWSHFSDIDVGGADPAAIRVRTMTLDGAIAPSQSVAFIKIDVEGAEIRVLQGAASTIRRCRPVIVIEHGNASDGGTSALYDFLTPLNYGIQVVGGRGKLLDRQEFLRALRTDWYWLARPLESLTQDPLLL
jgi:FkbM family methyltransferase